MKETYIRQVRRALRVSRKLRREVVRDLNEMFASALDNGETEEQVIKRLGPPKEFADGIADQICDNSAKTGTRRAVIAALVALVIAIFSLSLYAATQSDAVPPAAIGQGEAMIDIQIAGALGFDVLPIVLAVGCIAALIAILLVFRILHKRER